MRFCQRTGQTTILYLAQPIFIPPSAPKIYLVITCCPMLRLGSQRLAPALRRTALCQSKSTALYHSAGGGHTRTGQGLSAEVLPGIATARTPERTAELEALAEKHNGFLFGELVRSTALL